jgi:HEAT repeat protein
MEFYRPPTLQRVLDALGCVHRALRAWKFYPPGHPSRKAGIRQAHSAMLFMLDGNDLSLNSGRKYFSFPDGEVLKDTTHISASLSYEFFIRRIQKITFLHDLTEEDLLDFLRILTLPFDVVQKSGGVDKLMEEHGVRTIWANEYDLSTINARRQERESGGKTPQTVDEVESGLGLEWVDDLEQPADKLDDLNSNDELLVILGRLSSTLDEDLYLLAVRQAITCSDTFTSRNDLAALSPLVELLAEHANDAARGEGLRNHARFGLEQLALGDALVAYLLDHTEAPDALSHEAMLAFLSAAGPAGINLAIAKMGSTDSLAVRKELISLLVGLGAPAVPVILTMMQDKRWYIVRNLCTILGDIGRPEAVPDLLACLKHADIRVCKESIRSLAKIGGRDAESAVIAVLHGNNSALFSQVIVSLGGMKSRKALAELMYIVCSRDMFLKNLSLKLDALGAITMIGDRQAVPILTKILASRHILARSRWDQLKIAIAGCLARLGDVRALPILKKKASGSAELGRACTEAVETIERMRGEQYGGA